MGDGPRPSSTNTAGSQSRCSAPNTIVQSWWVSQAGFVLEAKDLLLLVQGAVCGAVPAFSERLNGLTGCKRAWWVWEQREEL